jgi:hypothetical protein
MAALDDQDEEDSARFTMLEFAVEVILANMAAGWPAHASEAFKADFKDRMRKGYSSSPMDDTHEVAQYKRIMERSAEMGDHFIDKVARREAGIRKHLASFR